jgi:hypothetical protein
MTADRERRNRLPKTDGIPVAWDPNSKVITHFSKDGQCYQAFVHDSCGSESCAERREIDKSLYPAFEAAIRIRCGRDLTMDEYLKEIGHAPFHHYGSFNVIRGTEVLEVSISNPEEKRWFMYILITQRLMHSITLRLQVKLNFKPVLTDQRPRHITEDWIHHLLDEAIHRGSSKVEIAPSPKEDVLEGSFLDCETNMLVPVGRALDCRDQASLVSIFTERQPWEHSAHELTIGLPTDTGLSFHRAIISDSYVDDGIQCYTILAKPMAK